MTDPRSASSPPAAADASPNHKRAAARTRRTTHRSRPRAAPSDHAQILDSLSDGVLALDDKSRVTYCNAAAVHLLGVGRQALVGQRLPAPLHLCVTRDGDTHLMTDAADWIRLQDRSGDHPLFVELEASTATVWLAVRVAMSDDRGGCVLTLRTAARQHGRMALDHDLLSGLIRGMRDTVVVTDLQLRITQLLGTIVLPDCTRQESLIGRHLIDGFTVDLEAEEKESFRRDLLEVGHGRVEVRVRGGAALWRDIDVAGSALYDSHGERCGYFAVCRDITELREASRRTHQSHERLTRALSGSDDGVWELHLPSGTLDLSPRCAEFLDLAPAADLSRVPLAECRSHLHPSEWLRLESALTGMPSGPIREQEVRLLDRDGEERWVLTRFNVVEWSDEGRPVRVAGTASDVSVRHAADVRLRAALLENERLVTQLRDALENVTTLRGLVPMCAWCKKIRSDSGFWLLVEEYIVRHTDANLTHGICPDCYVEHMVE